MPKLLYVPRFDEHGAAPRYRVYQFLDSIRSLGIEITVKPLFDIKYLNNLYFKKMRSISGILKTYIRRAIFLTLKKNKFDIVLMDGELFPFIPYFIEKFFLPKHYIIDQDDAIFHTYDHHRLWIVRKLLGNKIAKVWKNSQHLIVCNSYIKEKATLMGVKTISMLPTVVDANKYRPIENNLNSTKEDLNPKDSVVIGWVGSPTTIDAIEHIKPALLNVSKKTNISLSIIGAHYPIEGIKTVCVDWQEGWDENEEINLTNKIDIGIMPLVDGPYQKGKGGFKLIKYMACGKPIIASPVGINVDIVDHGVNGYLADTQKEWEKYLLALIENITLRQQFGKAGREKMMAKYSYQVVQPILCKIIEQAINIKKQSAYK